MIESITKDKIHRGFRRATKSWGNESPGGGRAIVKGTVYLTKVYTRRKQQDQIVMVFNYKRRIWLHVPLMCFRREGRKWI